MEKHSTRLSKALKIWPMIPFLVVLTLVLLQGHAKQTAANLEPVEVPAAWQFLCSLVLVCGAALWAHRVFPRSLF